MKLFFFSTFFIRFYSRKKNTINGILQNKVLKCVLNVKSFSSDNSCSEKLLTSHFSTTSRQVLSCRSEVIDPPPPDLLVSGQRFMSVDRRSSFFPSSLTTWTCECWFSGSCNIHIHLLLRPVLKRWYVWDDSSKYSKYLGIGLFFYERLTLDVRTWLLENPGPNILFVCYVVDRDMNNQLESSVRLLSGGWSSPVALLNFPVCIRV